MYDYRFIFKDAPFSLSGIQLGDTLPSSLDALLEQVDHSITATDC
jgi:hypothetical protein